MNLLLIGRDEHSGSKIRSIMDELNIEYNSAEFNKNEIKERLNQFSFDLILITSNKFVNDYEEDELKYIAQESNLPILFVSTDPAQTESDAAEIKGIYFESYSTPVKLYASIAVSIEKYRYENIIMQKDRNIADALQQMADGVITTNDNGNILRINSTALKICGFEESEQSNCNFAEYFRVQFLDTSEEWRYPFKSAMEMETMFESDDPVRFINNLGQTYYLTFRITPFTNPEFDIVGYAIVFSNVTEHYLNELELMKSEKLYREVVEKANDFITTTDITGTCTYMNTAVLRFTGYKKSDILGKRLFEFVSPDKRESAKNTFLILLIQIYQIVLYNFQYQKVTVK